MAGASSVAEAARALVETKRRDGERKCVSPAERCHRGVDAAGTAIPIAMPHLEANDFLLFRDFATGSLCANIVFFDIKKTRRDENARLGAALPYDDSDPK
jgi:hypothetical protein